MSSPTVTACVKLKFLSQAKVSYTGILICGALKSLSAPCVCNKGAYEPVHQCNLLSMSEKGVIYNKNSVKRPLKNEQNKVLNDKWLCRSKVLQNAPLGAFCNTFDMH